MDPAALMNRLLTPSLANENLVLYSGMAALLVHALTQVAEPDILFVAPAALLTLLAEPLLFFSLGDQSIFHSLISTTIVNLTFTATLFTSIAIYRLAFHRLRRFPGPKLAALSKFWHFTMTSDGTTPAQIEALHRKHGDVVRIGPNELSILNASAIPLVLGIQGKMDKGPWYKGSFTKKGMSVHALRGIHDHAQRRKFWDRAFSGKALLDYQVFINQCGEEWIEKLKKITAKPGTSINIAEWSSFVSFDAMGYAGFGDTFGMVRDGKAHFYMTTIESAMKGLCMFSEISWIMPLLSLLPAGREQADMYEFSMATTKQRQERGTAGKPDVFAYLVGEDQPQQADLTINELDADIRTVIIAGSDTVASTTTFIIYYLLQHPDVMKALQEEVEHLRGPGKTFDNTDLTNLKLLNAVINETLRVKTVVPSKSQRVVPKEGVMLAGEYIPGGTCVSVPFRATHHDPRNFAPETSSWRPDRWLAPEKEQAMNLKAFMPFSTGPFNCAGRLLALLELRVFTTMFVHNFNGRITPGFDIQKFEDSIVDRFTVQKGALMVELTAR